MDLTKAFDSVTHEAVIDSAWRHGIAGRVLNFVFLEGHTFAVRVDGDTGRTYPNAVGVLQVSILSPLLFNLTMIDLAKRLEEIPEHSFTIYADDITLWTNSRPAADQQRTLQAALNAIDDYLPQTGMSPSPEKTTYIVICGSPQDEMYLSLFFGGKKLKQAEKPVTFSDSLLTERARRISGSPSFVKHGTK